PTKSGLRSARVATDHCSDLANPRRLPWQNLRSRFSIPVQFRGSSSGRIRSHFLFGSVQAFCFPSCFGSLPLRNTSILGRCLTSPFRLPSSNLGPFHGRTRR